MEESLKGCVMQCPLCNSKAHLDQSVNSTELIDLWARSKVDVKSIITSNMIGKYACGNCGLGFYFPFFPGDDEFYGKLALWDWYYKHPGKTEYDFAAKLAMPGMKLIDVGCGIGEFSAFLSKNVDFLGVELSSKSVEFAKNLGRNVEKIDINNAPSNLIDHFDIVTCFQVLEHIVDVDAFINSLIKLCKPGGIIIIAVPNNDGFVGRAVNNILNMPPHHILLWNQSSLRFLAKKYNLDIYSYFEERLTDVHRSWFFSVLIRRFVMGLLAKPHSVIVNDRTLFARVLNRFVNFASRSLSFIFHKLDHPGHSSIIVFKKPSYAEI